MTRFGIAMPQSFSTQENGRARMAAFLTDVEAVGLDSVWVQEQMLGRDPSLEPLLSLAYAASATTSVRLGTATVVGPLRDPVLLAKMTATLDVLSGGRLILGLSIGEVAQIYDAVGVAMSQRGARLDELLDVVTALWTQSRATVQGRHWSFDGIAMEPKPVQDPHPPIWLGGGSRPALRRVARRATGWIGAGGASLDEFAGLVGVLEEELAAAGRARDEVTVAKKLYLAIDDDPAAARAGLEGWFQAHWPPAFDPAAMARRVGVAGDAAAIDEAVDEVIDAGADLIILNPVFDEDLQLARLTELLGQDKWREHVDV